MQTSESIKGIATALAKFQGEVEGVRKDRSNPHFRSQYSTLAEVVDTIKEPMSKNGLAFVQLPGLLADGRLEFTTLIMHGESGEWIKASTTIPLTKQDAQGYGSALSYVRRYALMSVLGLPSVDDDAEAATGRDNGQPQQRQSAPATPLRSAKAADEYLRMAKTAIDACAGRIAVYEWWKSEGGNRQRAGLTAEQEDGLKAMCANRVTLLNSSMGEAAE